MEVQKFNQMDETLYYEMLPNGLQVYLVPKAGFNKTYATFTTKYGSIDNHFTPLGKTEPIRVPDGIAHFLEHKLFEKVDYDVFQKFSAAGASSNAFTSFTRTAYLFQTTSDVKQNLTTLLDFVQEPYFTEETVEKEKGIIEEEIKMYEDNADFKAYFGLLNNMYANNPIKIDIAGTVDSIYQITADDLQVCYDTFYHPSNMILFVVGDIEPESIMNLVRDNQAAKNYPKAPEIKRIFPEEPTPVACSEKTVTMPVGTPKVFVGVKGEINKQDSASILLKTDLALDILMDLVFGTSTDYYESLIEQELANDTFSYESTHEPESSFCFVGTDTNKPKEFIDNVKARILEIPNFDFNEVDFERIKRKKIGQFLVALNSVEFIANRFTEYAFNGVNLFNAVTILEDLSLIDIDGIARNYFKPEQITVFTIMPAEEN